MFRLCVDESQRRFDSRMTFVVVAAEAWEANVTPPKLLGQWLVEGMPQSANLEIPDRGDSGGEIPFSDEDDY